MKKLKQTIKDKLGEKKTAMLKKSLRVARIIKNIVCWSLIAVITLAIITFMVTKISGGTPSVFGYSIHRIVSGSMEPEFAIGDVILNKEVHDVSEVHVGDIITFQGNSNFSNQKVAHRVLVAPYDDGKGNTVLVTKGDANEVDDGEIDFNSVESKYLSKVGFLKSIYNFFFSPWGFIIFIFLLLLIFFDEIMNIIKLSAKATEQEQPESLYEIFERIQREQQEAATQESLPEKSEQKKSAKSDKEKLKSEKEKTSSKKSENQKKNQKNKQKSKKNSGKNKNPQPYYPTKKKKKKKSKKRKKR